MTQPLASMTGYARVTGAVPGAAFVCEVKSVNGRGLDLRMRLAPGFDALEVELRQLVARTLSRGSVTINLTVDREDAGGDVVVNRKALETVLATMAELGPRLDAERPRLEGILALKGVLDQRDHSLAPHEEEQVTTAIMTCVAQALSQLTAARRQEGARLATVLLAQLDEIEALVVRAERHPSRGRDAVLARLRQQVAQISADITIPEDRLAQEALLLATKADIREELDRLTAHLASARQLIVGGGAVGRRLDFLAQEFNREANTLCSKSNAAELTAIGLDLKAAIDQLREQVQNIE